MTRLNCMAEGCKRLAHVKGDKTLQFEGTPLCKKHYHGVIDNFKEASDVMKKTPLTQEEFVDNFMKGFKQYAEKQNHKNKLN